jgi:hypothetical protein
VKAAWIKANPDKKPDEAPPVLKADNKEELEMTEDIKKLTDKVDELTGRLAKSELRASMSDAERKHYDGLTGDAQIAFGKADADARQAVLKRAAEADETFTVEGTTVRKGEVGAATFELLKKQQARIDAEAEIAKAERGVRVQKELEARAEKELPNLVGTPAEKAEMLKAIDAMPEAARAAQMKMLKSADDAMAKQFKELGQGGQGTDATAAGKLDKMAADLALKEKITVAKAYSRVLDTEEGAKLYAETLKN